MILYLRSDRNFVLYSCPFSTEAIQYGFHKSNKILEDSKDTQSVSPIAMEQSSSSLLENELIITTTCAGSTNTKQFPLPSVSTACCESDQTSSDQDCFNLHGNLEEHLSSHFEHGSTVNHDEELDMTFPQSVYGEIGEKDIGSFHTEGARCSRTLMLNARSPKLKKKEMQILFYLKLFKT